MAKKIKEWQSAGLINDKQAQTILEYEANQNKNWASNTLTILAAAVIGLGCISLIAFNWYSISPQVKLGADFIILIGLAAAIIYSAPADSKKFDYLALIFIIFCMASIALIAQIYNLSGPIYNTLFMWCAMTFLVVCTTKHTFIWWLWLGALINATADWYLELSIINQITNNSMVLLSLFSILSAVIIYLKSYSNSGFQSAARIWVVTLLLIFLFIYELTNVFDKTTQPIAPALVPVLLPLIVLLLTVPGVVNTSSLKHIQKVLILSLFLVLTGFYLLGVYAHPGEFISAFFTGIVLMLCAILAASLDMRRLFNLFIILLGLRTVGLYIQALGGMAATGLGLIILGVLILYVTKMWRKYSEQLLAFITRWTDAK